MRLNYDEAEGKDKTFIFFRDQLTERNIAMAEILNSEIKNDDESKLKLLNAFNYRLESYQRDALIAAAKKFIGNK